MTTDTRAVLGLVVAAGLVAAAAEAGSAKTMPMTTKSPAAHDELVELQRRIETFQFTGNEDRAKKIVAADPEFALGVYYLSAVTPPPGNQQHLDKAVELARKGGASDAERRFIEAMVLARGKNPEQAIEPLTRLTVDYPKERLFFMLLGQNLAGAGKQEEAKAAFEKAIALDPTTPRAYTFVGNYYLMKGDYEKARELYRQARAKTPAGVAPGSPPTPPPSPTSTRATSTRPWPPCRATWTSTARTRRPRTFPRSSSGTPSPASTWRTAAWTRP